jgi:hypothetical protein
MRRRSASGPWHEVDAPWGTVLAAPRPCTRCKEPTIFATPRGRAAHPFCEGWLDVMPFEAEVLAVIAILSAGDVAETWIARATDAPPRRDRDPYAEEPCSVCGSHHLILKASHVHPQHGPYRDWRCPRHLLGHPDEYGVPWFPFREMW